MARSHICACVRFVGDPAAKGVVGFRRWRIVAAFGGEVPQLRGCVLRRRLGGDSAELRLRLRWQHTMVRLVVDMDTNSDGSFGKSCSRPVTGISLLCSLQSHQT